MTLNLDDENLTDEGVLISRALSLNLACELHEMLLGNGKYADVDAINRLDGHSRRLRVVALSHLSYLCNKRQDSEESFSKDGYIYYPSENYFLAWILAGCPGISFTLLKLLVRDCLDRNNEI